MYLNDFLWKAYAPSEVFAKVWLVFFTPGAVYPTSISRHFFGHTLTQLPHWTQSKRSIVHVPALRSTVIAWDGHERMHRPQVIQSSIRISMCPRMRSGYWAGSKGYWVVSGFRKRLWRTLPANLNNRVFSILLLHSTAFAVLVSMNYHRSVQLMHGSIVRISSGTSASWHPFNISAIGGILLVVGVRRRKRSRNFVPFPLT